MGNRWTKNPATETLPPVAVTADERKLVLAAAKRGGLSIAELVRLALVRMRVLPETALGRK